ncbi:hypothetical protein M527_16035 [Sphingobium indicum IP26]|uniref:DUF2523 domain-containing protein n=1 Tax=Sphingobium indicum F2 TaxID=1450518 RepID=A0A8E0WUI9_9SPHN|nr:hypothetical protein [Sphingobium indicum]EPR17569.1 hypothetical protein M527_16035 [Sphingobium indicum IP26]KER37634.1 hypothetical protein AL00_04285 [Sphingobium indicum F2]
MAVLSFLTSKSAGGAIGYLTKGIGSKLIAFVVLIFVFKAAFVLIGELLPEFNYANMFDGLPGAFLYGLWYVDAPFGLNVIMAAYALVFFIKRLPVVG